jgi:hypothetical protein
MEIVPRKQKITQANKMDKEQKQKPQISKSM